MHTHVKLMRPKAGWPTWAMYSGEIKAGCLSTTKTQDADELTLIGDSWLQSRNGVRVHMAWNSDLHPLNMGVFLFKKHLFFSLKLNGWI